MINIFDVYNFNNTLLNKDQSGQSFTADQFNLVAPFAMYEFLKQKGGLPEDYRVGMPLSPQMWQVSEKITDDIVHLLVWKGGPDSPILLMDQYGISDKPTDYLAFSSCYYNEWIPDGCDSTKGKYRPRPIEFLPDALWGDRLDNPIKKPTYKNPVAKMFGSKFQFAPADMGMVNFSYLRQPATPFLSVTIDSNSEYVYDAAGSTQFEVPQTCLPDIAAIIRLYQAGNIQSQLYIQMAAQRKERGI